MFPDVKLCILAFCFSVCQFSYGLHSYKDAERWNTDFTQSGMKGNNGRNEGIRKVSSDGRSRVFARGGDNYVTPADLDKAMAGMQQNLNVVISQMNELKSQMQKLNQRVDSQNSSIIAIQAQQEDERKLPPMFYGQLADQVYYDNGKVYKFANVQVNQGGNFNPDDGKFTCGPTGLYFFTFSFYGYKLAYGGDYELYGALMKDNEKITSAYAANHILPKDGGDYLNLQASTSALLKCEEGQKVYVSAASWQSGSMKTTTGDFVAMLMRKEE